MNGSFRDSPWRRRAPGTGEMEPTVERTSVCPGSGPDHQLRFPVSLGEGVEAGGSVEVVLSPLLSPRDGIAYSM